MMTEVFLDTNIIIKEGFFRSAFVDGVLKSATLLGVKVLIPEIVITEVKENFKLQLKEQLDGYKKSHNKLSNLIDSPAPKIVFDDEVNKYNDFFDDLLTEHGVERLPYPEILTEEIVNESYKGKKPFKSKGEGYKDYLVWRTIKSYCGENPNATGRFFITENVKDFCEKLSDDTFALHLDLAISLESAQEVPLVLLSLKEFFDTALQPFLKTLQLEDVRQLDVKEATETILQDSLTDYNAPGFEELGFGDDVTVVFVEEINVEKTQLSEVNENDILINVSGNVVINVDGFMEKREYYFSDDKNIDVYDPDWNDHMMAVSQCIKTPFELVISYSKKDGAILDHTVKLPNELSYHDW